MTKLRGTTIGVSLANGSSKLKILASHTKHIAFSRMVIKKYDLKVWGIAIGKSSSNEFFQIYNHSIQKNETFKTGKNEKIGDVML